jgi:EF-hand domain pair
MSKVAKIALVTISLVAGAASGPAFAQSVWALEQGKKETRQLLRLMDTDQNGRVSKAEFMRFMEAEFDRLDVDHSGELSVQELSHFYYRRSYPGGTSHR